VEARKHYEFQDFNFTGDYGDNGFLEDYTSQVQGEPLSVIVTVTRNAAGKAQHVVVNHRPRNSLLLFSRLMHEKFAGTPLAAHFLADESLNERIYTRTRRCRSSWGGRANLSRPAPRRRPSGSRHGPPRGRSGRSFAGRWRRGGGRRPPRTSRRVSCRQRLSP